ncbi:unnamed protein product [Parnassius mnemosyne]|uniref:Peptidase M10 metallopeptidase domain-containing protein n=1 Tax=Parnassius mnemosyne TaxID=213953 RepID=A0AAV1LYA6_9NEOP
MWLTKCVVFIALMTAVTHQTFYYDYGDDIAYTPYSLMEQNGIVRAIDENFKPDWAPILHNKWIHLRELEWAFNCSSVDRTMGTRIPYHIAWDEDLLKFTWIKPSRGLFCQIMNYMIDNAFREWLDPLADKLSHHSVDRGTNTGSNPSGLTTKISFEPFWHHHDDGSPCMFTSRNTLAHANGDFVHINAEIDWCVMGSKTPRYLLKVHSGNVILEPEPTLDASYGQALVQYMNRNKFNCINLYTVLIHELGHTLGLGHASLATSLMFPTAGSPLNQLHSSDFTFSAQLYRN